MRGLISPRGGLTERGNTAVQGFGGGGCLSITEIIYADMVPLPERGKFQGIIAS